MKQEDKLRNTLREYYDNLEEPYNHEDWQQASAYIAAIKRKKKIRGIGFTLVILLSASFVFLLDFPNSSNCTEQRGSEDKEQKSKTESERNTVAHNRPKAAAQKQFSADKNIKHINSPEITELSVGKTNASDLQFKANGIATVEKNPPTVEAQPGEPQVNFADQKNKPLNNKTPEKDLVTAPAILAPDPTPAVDNAATIADVEKIAVQAPAINPGTALTNKPEEKPASEVLPAGEKNEAVTKDVLTEMRDENQVKQQNNMSINALASAENGDAGPKTPALSSAEHKKEIFEPVTNIIPVKVKPVLKDTFSTASFADTTSSSDIETWDTLRRPGAVNFVVEGIFYEAGAAWLYGWKGPMKRDARGFSPMAGINYMNRLNNRCGLSFGVQYMMVSKLSNSSKTSRVSSYVYGEQSQVTVITPTTLHYLAVPLRIHCYANRNNCFGTGVNLGYLLNVDAKVTSYEETAGVKGAEETIRQGGYTQGFSWYDTQVAVFYRRKINASLALQTEIFFGLTDVKQDTFFGYNNKERNSGVKLSLVYHAFKKNNR